MVKWKDFGVADCTWEPAIHLPQNVIRTYVPTVIDVGRLKVFSDAFERSIQSRLKSKDPTCVVYVELDVFRSLFGDVPSKLCNLSDFDSLQLSDHWFYSLNHDGTGRKLKFPIKLSARLLIRKMYVKQEGRLILKAVPIEKCVIYSCTEACTVDDL